ncbi:unnamed protein product, partial [marine sediment metagenome]
GLSAGCGFALSGKLLNKDFHTFVVMSDGEQQKGQVSEARRFAKKYNLNELTVIDEYAKVISSGMNLPGTILRYVNNEFMEELRRSDLVIVKGQGNFEGLEEEEMEKTYFLLKAKCKVVADYLGCRVGDLIIKRSN